MVYNIHVKMYVYVHVHLFVVMYNYTYCLYSMYWIDIISTDRWQLGASYAVSLKSHQSKRAGKITQEVFGLRIRNSVLKIHRQAS